MKGDKPTKYKRLAIVQVVGDSTVSSRNKVKKYGLDPWKLNWIKKQVALKRVVLRRPGEETSPPKPPVP